MSYELQIMSSMARFKQNCTKLNRIVRTDKKNVAYDVLKKEFSIQFVFKLDYLFEYLLDMQSIG